MDDEITLPLRTVVCHTNGCENESLPVTFECLEYVICGVCGQRITDIHTHE